MARFRISVRAFLITLALGLASVNVGNDLHRFLTEISVDLPQTYSDSPIFVVPESERNPIHAAAVEPEGRGN